MTASAKVFPLSRPVRLIVNRTKLESSLAGFHAVYDPALKDLHEAIQTVQKGLNAANPYAYPMLSNVADAIEAMLHHFAAPPALLKYQAVTGPLPAHASFASAGNTIALAHYLESLIRAGETPEHVRHAAADAYIVITERLRDTDFQKEFEDLSLQLEAFCRQLVDDSRPVHVAKTDMSANLRLQEVLHAARSRMRPVYNQA